MLLSVHQEEPDFSDDSQEQSSNVSEDELDMILATMGTTSLKDSEMELLQDDVEHDELSEEAKEMFENKIEEEPQLEKDNISPPEEENKLQPEEENKLQPEEENKLQPEEENKLQPEEENKLQPEEENKLQPEEKNKPGQENVAKRVFKRFLNRFRSAEK